MPDTPVWAIDRLAVALATPVSRRRSMALFAGALIGGELLHPLRARAQGVNCSGDTPKKCSHPGGAAVCVSADSPCCSSTTCAQACKPWQRCINEGAPNAGCPDTPALCLVATEGGGPPRPKFCPQTFTTLDFLCSKSHETVRGYCCRAGEKCGTASGECICDGDDCANACCGAREVCESSFGSESICLKLCPDGKKPCNGVCCTGLETCGFFGCSCKSGYVPCGTGRCCLPKDDAGDPKPKFNPIRDMLNMMGASSAAHGGGAQRALFARGAQSGAAEIDVALDALAAVNAQGAAAMFALREGRRDRAYRQRVTVARVSAPTVGAGPSLDPASAAALNALLAAQAKANALIAATAKALWRSRAAHAKRDRRRARSQLRASASFARQAAAALKRVSALRTAAANALTAGNVAEVVATEDAVAAFIAATRSTGIPATLRTPLRGLGVGPADLKRLQTHVLGQTVTAATGAVLIAPLTSAQRATELRQFATELAQFSTRARRHRIAR